MTLRVAAADQRRHGARRNRPAADTSGGLADPDDGDAVGVIGREIHSVLRLAGAWPRRGSRRAAARRPAARDLPRQLAAAAVDARFHGAFRQRRAARRFPGTTAPGCRAAHRVAQRRRQLVQRLAQQLDAVALLERARRAPGPRDAGVQVAGVDVAIDRLALLADAAVVVDAEVAADADQPGLEVRAAVERVAAT